MIKFIDLAKQNSELKDEILTAISRTIDSSNFILGDEVKEFENNICNLLNIKHCVGLNSGTDALIHALLALDIKANDEIITVSNSFISTASAIKIIGAKPVFVDINELGLIDPDKIIKSITKKTKAIIPVHLMGMPANMPEICKIAKQFSLKVIEDAAQAIGAKHNNKSVGTFGDVGCFSFHPLKNLGAMGDAGAIVTNSSKIYKKVALLRNLGLKDRNTCIEISGNSRLDSMQAVILDTKLKHLNFITLRKRELATIYINNLSSIKELKLPIEPKKTFCVYHTFIIEVLNGKRDALQEYLQANDIETKIHYPKLIHTQKPFKDGTKYSLPNSEKYVKSILSLPIDYTLKDEDIQFVCQKILDFFN